MPPPRRKTLEVARRDEGALKLEGRLVLLVDDDRGVLELLRRGLEPQVGPLGARYWTFPPDFKDRVQRLFTPASAASSPR